MGKKEYYLGGDPAKLKDFFGLVVLERQDNKIRLEAQKEIQCDYNIVANYIQALHSKYKFRKIFMDNTGVGVAFVDMLTGKKLPVEPITLSNPMKVEIVESVIRLQQEGRLKLPRLGAKELKQQLREQERDLTQSGMVRLVHPQNAHDDLFWAFCIGCYDAKKLIDVPKGFGISYHDIEAKENTEEGMKAQGRAWVQRGKDGGSGIGRRIDYQ